VCVKHHQRCLFLQQVPQNGQQHRVFEDVGVVSGVKGVAITEHDANVNRHSNVKMEAG
jgi:hypothetical protein